jgi:Glycosyltransferase family 10 (fucosyltransferase) C-term
MVGSYNYPLKRLFPDGEAKWGHVKFTTEPVEKADFVVSLNYPQKDIRIECPPEHCWSLVQEPPARVFHWMHSSNDSFARLYSSDTSIRGPWKILTHPHMHWHVKRGLEWLRQAEPPKKTADLSTITSDMRWLDGHRRRLDFVRSLSQSLDFDWFGRGIRPLEDKWDGLAPYRYSLAIENFCSDYYWTEKLIDCFLCWTVPLYYGCPRLEEYFPARSFIRIDITNAREATRVVMDTLENDRYEDRLEALEQARSLILESLNPMAFLAGEVERHLADGCTCRSTDHTVRGRDYPKTFFEKVRSLAKYKLEQTLSRPIGW